ncbi:transmembrane protein 132C-like isoform X2 [Mustelus asterias]
MQQVLPGLPAVASPSRLEAGAHPNPSWRIRAHVVEGKVHAGWPRAQVLFHVSGRDWNTLDDQENLPCVSLHAFRERQEVRGDCRLKGPLGICVASLELPVGWFPPSARSGRRRRGEVPGTTREGSVELYFRTLQPGDCGRVRFDESGGVSREELESVGRLVLLALPAEQEVRLDANVLLRLPARSLRPGETVGVALAIMTNISADEVVIRAKLKKGVRIVSIHPSVPEVWNVELQHSHGSKHRIATVTCTRSHTLKGWSSPGLDSRDIAWLELEMEEFIGEAVTRRIAWQVEYGDRRAVLDRDRTITELMVTQRDVQGLVPLATEEEVLNTAVLTGRLVTVPIKAVTVDGSGLVTDVTEFVECTSEDRNIVKVSKGCDYIYVDGKETGGRQGIRVDLSYERLRATLHLTVWVPKLPLQVQLSDSQLSQVKGWRVPIQSETSPAGDIEGEEEEEAGESKRRGCSLQYQQATLRILTQLVAGSRLASGERTVHMLGTEWQVDVTEMVAPLVRVGDAHVVKVNRGRRLVGLKPGVTTVQVLSPVSDSILGQQTVTVADDKVAITDMDVQLVTGIRLSLRQNRRRPRVVIATATAQESLHTPKQEGVLNVWLKYSDGTAAPLQLYNPEDYSLTVSSLDEGVVSVRHPEAAAEPMTVVAEGGGGGQLLRVKLAVPTACHKSKRRNGLVLASAEARVEVLFEQDSQAETERAFPEWERYDTRVSEREEGAMKVESTTRRLHREGQGAKWATGNSVFAAHDPGLRDLPSETEAPTTLDPLPGFGGEEFSMAFKGVTDLEIGMYALLGVFCLAILVFFINCVTFVLKYRHKELPPTEPGQPPHWVWSGAEREGAVRRTDISPRERAVSLGPGRQAHGGSIRGGSRHRSNGWVSRANPQGLPDEVSRADLQGLPDGVSWADPQGLPDGVSRADPQGLPDRVSGADLQGLPDGISLPNVQGFTEGVSPPSVQGFTDGDSLPNAQGFTDGDSLPNAQGFADGVSLPNVQGLTDGVSSPCVQGFTDGVYLSNVQGFTDGVSLLNSQGCPDGVSQASPRGPLRRPSVQKQHRAPGGGWADMRTGGWRPGEAEVGEGAPAGEMRRLGSRDQAGRRGSGSRAGATREEADIRSGSGAGEGEAGWASRACAQGFVDGYCTIKGVSRGQGQRFRLGALEDFRPQRVQLSTFAAPGKLAELLPTTQSIIVADEEDIRWVCQDMGLQDPEQLRSYMERIREAS